MERHGLDLLSLLAGLFFLVVGVIALIDVPGLTLSLIWIWPIGLMILGLGLLLSALRRSDEA